MPVDIRASMGGEQSDEWLEASKGNAGAWRADLASFSFRPDGHEGLCVVHQRAFNTLLRRVSGPEECERYFHSHSAAFQQAAAAKIKRACLAEQENFHLTSRDIMRELRPPAHDEFMD